MITFDLNLKANNATTQYLDFAFDSVVKIGNKFLCANESGLFELEGSSYIPEESKNSFSDIISYFELPTLDFGLTEQKRLRAIYFGYEADGDLTLKISTELSEEETYTIPASTNGNHARKININRSLKGRYWTFQIYSNGTVFSIDNISVLPIVRGHGFDQN